MNEGGDMDGRVTACDHDNWCIGNTLQVDIRRCRNVTNGSSCNKQIVHVRLQV